MKKLLFIIILFFSTSVFAEIWVKMNESFGLDFYQSKGYEVVDVKAFNLSEVTTLVYTLTHPQGGFKICRVFLNDNDLFSPVVTNCFSEDTTN